MPDRYTVHDYDAAWQVWDNVERRSVGRSFTEAGALAEAARLNEGVPALKPCPHCGEPPIYQHHEPHQHSEWLKRAIPGLPDHEGNHTIECAACGNGMIADTLTDVVMRWNRRITEISEQEASDGEG